MNELASLLEGTADCGPHVTFLALGRDYEMRKGGWMWEVWEG